MAQSARLRLKSGTPEQDVIVAWDLKLPHMRVYVPSNGLSTCLHSYLHIVLSAKTGKSQPYSQGTGLLCRQDHVSRIGVADKGANGVLSENAVPAHDSMP